MKIEDVRIVHITNWSADPGCHVGCGVLAHIKYGMLIKLEGELFRMPNRLSIKDLM